MQADMKGRYFYHRQVDYFQQVFYSPYNTVISQQLNLHVLI